MIAGEAWSVNMGRLQLQWKKTYMHTLDYRTLFTPRSIVVVGASTEEGSVGNDIAKNLLSGSYDGDIRLVNPKTDSLLGVRCYRDLADIESTPDLAIIVVPAAIVPTVLEQAGQLGIPSAIVISAGFRETGPEGERLEERITDIARSYDMTLLGPNCLGFIAPSIGLNASFAPFLPAAGPVAFLSQSGALMTAVLDMTRGKVGFSKFISTGNKAVLNEHALISYLKDDPDTRVIAFYAEGLTDAPGIIRLGRELIASDTPKPLIVLKSGRTESGIKASGSHTGSLAGSDASYEALFRQARIVRAETMREFLETIDVFSKNVLPKGNRLVIITNAGGPGVLAADAAARAGLTLAKLTDLSIDRLRSSLPAAASVTNPIDLLGDAKTDRYRTALATAVSDPGVDSILVILTPQSMTEAEATAKAILQTRNQSEKPIVAVFSGADRLASGRAILENASLSTFSYPEEGASALGTLSRVSGWGKTRATVPEHLDDLDTQRVRDIFKRVRSEGRDRLYEYEAYDVLAAYRFPLLRIRVARNAEEAERSALEIGSPVAMKIISPDILHKTDAGGVSLDVLPEDAAERYIELLDRVRQHNPGATLEGAMIMEMAEHDGKELILGAKKESGLGTILVLGMGGIYTEAIHDASFRFAPIDRYDAAEMLSELRSAELLSGIRGESGIDREKLYESLIRLSLLVTDFPEIAELDINPLFAFPDPRRFSIADARIALDRVSE